MRFNTFLVMPKLTSYLLQTETWPDKKWKAYFVGVSNIKRMTKTWDADKKCFASNKYHSFQHLFLSSILPHTCWVPRCPAGHTVPPHSPYSRSHKMWCEPGSSPLRPPLHIALFPPLHHKEEVIIRCLLLSSRQSCVMWLMPRTVAVNVLSAANLGLLEQCCTVWNS